MEKIKDKVHIRGTGIAGLTSRCVVRTPQKAIYLRSDGYYEVFKVIVVKEGYVFDKLLPEREVYPGNEDFGSTAWTFKTKESALERYNSL